MNNAKFVESPKVGDTVFVTAFAFDGGQIINNYSGFGVISEKSTNGIYLVDFQMKNELPECYDSAGTNENAPESVFFDESNIIYCKNGSVAVHLPNINQYQP
jgi:hypothetical protein